MRKFLSLFFSVTLAMTMLPAVAFAAPDGSDSQVADAQETSEIAPAIESRAGNIATGMWGTCPWEISEDGVLTVHPGKGAESADMNYSPWKAYNDSITKVVFVREGGKRVMAPSNCRALFGRMPNITEVDLTGFDTSKTTTMADMFIMCPSLISVDLSNLDTSNVTTMETLFGGCTSLTSVNLTGVNTSKLRWAAYMFSGCSSLQTLDLSSFNTSNLTNMYCMFSGCSALESLDLSHFNLDNVTDARDALRNCSSLTELKLGNKKSELKLPNNESNGRSDWYSFHAHKWQTPEEVNTSAEGAIGTYIKSEPAVIGDGQWGTCPWEISEDGVLTVYPGEGEPVYVFRNNKYEDWTPWKEYRDKGMIKKVQFLEEGGERVIAPENSRRLFFNMNVEQIDLSGIDTSQVESMQDMFLMAGSSDSIDLSSFDTSNVTNMRDMFSYSDFASLDLENFDTSKVTNMCSMFGDCSKLEYINLSSFQTARVTDMNSMFKGCKLLKSLDLSTFNTPIVKGMNSMFAYCNALEYLVFSSATIKSNTNIAGMFRDCFSIKSISLGENIESFPMPGTEWFSKKESKWFTVKEITMSRLGIADTYTNFRTPITKVKIDYGPDRYTYTGKKIAPAPVLTDPSGYTLVEGNDYTLKLEGDTVNVGEVTLTITGIGNYEGTAEHRIYINPAPITSITVNNQKSVWNGKRQYPNLTVSSNGTVLSTSDYYLLNSTNNMVNAGKYDVVIRGNGNYTGEKSIEFEIVPAPITRVEVVGGTETMIYDGTPKKPRIEVYDSNGIKLSEYMDYGLTYPEDITSAGTKEVTVRGWINHTGTKKISYEIVRREEHDPNPTPTPVPDPTPDPIPDPKPEPTPDPAPDPGPSVPDTPDTPNPPTQVVSQTMFRLYNPNSGEHFYTSSTVERDSVVAVGWQDEGAGWIAPAEGDPVYRLYNPYAGEHHYTPSVVERDSLIAAGWNDEGVGWCTGGTVPLYRQYNPNAYANNHNYSISAVERDHLLSIGWKDEGIAWYGVG